jgi:hypothetical protein
MLDLYVQISGAGHIFVTLLNGLVKPDKIICIQQNLYVCVIEIGCKQLLSDFDLNKAYIKNFEFVCKNQ